MTNIVSTLLRKKLDVHAVILLYCIKRLIRIPTQYNRLFHVAVVFPAVILSAIWWKDLTSQKYRQFLAGIAFPYSRLIGTTFHTCADHRRTTNPPTPLSHTPGAPSCAQLIIKELPLGFKRSFNLYTRFYTLQLLIILMLKRSLTLKQCRDTAVNIFRSSMWLAVQSMWYRILFCSADAWGITLTPVRMYVMSMFGALTVFIERKDRMGLLNTFMLSQLFIGYLKKLKLLQMYVTLPLLLGTLARDKGRVQPTAVLIAVVSALAFD